MNGLVICSGMIGRSVFSLFLKPDQSRSYFEFAYSFIIENFCLRSPFKKEIEQISNIKKFRFNFSMERLSETFTMQILDIVKEMVVAFEDFESSPQMVQDIKQKYMSSMVEVVKSKGILTYAIAPFEHHFGTLEAKAVIRSNGQKANPEGKLSAKLLKIDNILQKLKESGILSPDMLSKFLQALKQYTEKDGNGDAVLTVELKKDQPGVFFLNGVPTDWSLK